MKKPIFLMLLAAAAWSPLSQAAPVALTNNSFETPGLPALGNQFGGTSPGWTFENTSNQRSGFTTNGSAQSGGAVTTNGVQMAFVNKIGSFTSDPFIVGETDTTHVKLTFTAAQGSLNAIAQTVQVYLDNILIYQFVPTGTGAFNTYATPYVDLSLGAHALKFTGLGGTAQGGTGPGQASWAYIDNIQFTVPEPGTVWLFGLALAGLCFSESRKRGHSQG